MVAEGDIAALKQLNVETLFRLKSVLSEIDQRLYTHVNVKGRASVGQHVRHTLEFYLCLFEATDAVNYDNRKRDILIESSSEHASVTIDQIVEHVNALNSDFLLQTLAELPSASTEALSVRSSLSRELLYVLEHAIHHMALIRILIKDEQADFQLEDSFGVAYSTLSYRNQEANG
jgi:uncharacterized damage-inducible protein DinB